MDTQWTGSALLCKQDHDFGWPCADGTAGLERGSLQKILQQHRRRLLDLSLVVLLIKKLLEVSGKSLNIATCLYESNISSSFLVCPFLSSLLGLMPRHVLAPPTLTEFIKMSGLVFQGVSDPL